MKNYQRIFKAGLCSIFGSIAFSLFFWNGYMTSVGRHLLLNEFQGHAPFLMFLCFMMPLLMGISSGFAMIFYSIHLEEKERELERQERINARNELLENETLTHMERLDIIFSVSNK